jgi:hypothetical protein
MYVNRKMRLVETLPGMRREEKQRRIMVEVNSTMIYCKKVLSMSQCTLGTTKIKNKLH